MENTNLLNLFMIFNIFICIWHVENWNTIRIGLAKRKSLFTLFLNITKLNRSLSSFQGNILASWITECCFPRMAMLHSALKYVYLYCYSQRHSNAFKMHTYFIYITQECNRIKRLLFSILSLVSRYQWMGRDIKKSKFKTKR